MTRSTKCQLCGRQAMAAGEQDQVNLFLEAARRAKALAEAEAIAA